MGVFVELGEDSLSETLTDLKNQGEFESLVVADSVSYETFARVQRPAAVSVAANNAFSPTGGAGESASRSGLRGTRPSASSATQESIQQDDGPTKGGGFGEAAEGVSVAGKNIQYIAVPEGMFRKNATAGARIQPGPVLPQAADPGSDLPESTNAPGQALGGRGRQGQESPTTVAESTDRKMEPKKSQSQKPYRVLFVLVKGPATKTKPQNGAREATPPPAQPSPKSPDPGAAA